MNKNDWSREAAETLWSCRRTGSVITALPDPVRPQTRAQGYAVQAHFEHICDCAVLGWKIAATSKAGQDHIGVSEPLAGRLLENDVYRDGETITFGANRMAVAEAEFVFRTGRALPPRAEAWTLDQALEAVSALHIAIELPDSRFSPFDQAGEAQLIADNACTNAFVLGSAIDAAWRSSDLAEHRVTLHNDRDATHHGCGANVLGDPRIAFTWLVNELSRQQIGLGADQLVTTGTTTVPLPIEPGDHVTADFGPFGTVQVVLAPD